MLLKDLIKGLDIVDIQGNINIEITDVAYDSRKVVPGSIFVCIDGFKMDGHDFIEMAIDNKAAAIIVQKTVPPVPEGVTLVQTLNTRYALAYISNKFFEKPSFKINLHGVTGTKGKTTTTYMLKSILEASSKKVGVVGTIANMIGSEIIPAQRTTPESYDLQMLFSEMVNKDVSEVVMEVSSHALELHRVSCSNFDIGIFTNLSQDHLDFHSSMESYLDAKLKLFNMCKRGLVNIDTQYGRIILQKASCRTFTFGIDEEADFMAKNISLDRHGAKFDLVSKWGQGTVMVSIPGKFNVYNALGAIGAACLMGIPFSKIKPALKNISVPGRAQIVDINRDFSVIVDYAHSPDSLGNILETVKGFAKGDIICVFGCGGDRDRTKRPIMGEISGRLAHFTILTSDNPRTEEPKQIIQDIEEGLKQVSSNYVVIEDRKQAIKYALDKAKAEDVVVIAGKGHETYQIFKDKVYHFSDKEVVIEILKKEVKNSNNI